MKKRVISLFLAVIMIVGMLPLSAITAFAEDNDLSNGGEEKTAWTFDNTLPQSSGEYYLTKDVMLANAWTVKAGEDISLDLNGHTIRRDLLAAQSNGYVIGVSGKLTLSDSSEEKTGLITGGNNTGNGGGLYINSGAVVVMTDCRIEGNAAGGSAGIYNEGTLTAVRCSISSNRATGNAGGIYTSAGNATFIDSEIKNNRSDNFGGAFFVDYSASVTLDGCTVSGNSAKNGGGAFEMEKKDGRLVLKDSSVIGNSVDVKHNNMFKGGGIHFNLGSVTLKGKVIVKDNLCASLPDNICVRNSTVTFDASALTADSEIYLNDGALAVISGITGETLEALHMENGYHIGFSEDVKPVSHRPDFSGKYIDNGNGTHSRKCQLCSRLSAAEAHIDANQDGNCDVCGKTELKIGGLGLLTEGLNTSSAAGVNFGTDKNGDPVAFRVIGDENSGVKAPEGCLTLISADLVAPLQPFNEQGLYTEAYAGSMLQATVDSSVLLSDGEKAAVRPRTLEGGKSYSRDPVCDGVFGATVENAFFWAPTTADAVAMSTDLLGASSSWWLCSLGFQPDAAAAATVNISMYADPFVRVGGDRVDAEYGVRSAFYLDLSSVLLAASDSESVKLTLIDKTRSFDVTSVSGTAEKLTVSYTGAKTGSNESIAYLVVDADSAPKNCVTVASVTAENGTVEFDRPDLAGGERLFIANIENKPSVDLSSEPVEIEMPCIHDFTGTEYHDNGDGTHSAVCAKCGALSDPVTHDLTGNEYRDNGNGTHSRKCTVCGGCDAAAYHTYESVDAETHRCTVCALSENHTDDGTCGLCGQIQYYYEYNEATGEFEAKKIPADAVMVDEEADLKVGEGKDGNYDFFKDWYVITKSFSLTQKRSEVYCFDDTDKVIHIILADGVTLNATKGIRVCNPLTVYATSLDESKMGTIKATARNMGEAGIGSGLDEGGQFGFNSYSSDDITIHGGRFEVTGGSAGAGIGGGYLSADTYDRPCGDITIYGGYFNVKGGKNAPAIGVGLKSEAPSTDITIFGGTFKLQTGEGCGAVLGTGGEHDAEYLIKGVETKDEQQYYTYYFPSSIMGNITINGGYFSDFSGGDGGAAIGTGARGKCGDITINGGWFQKFKGNSAYSKDDDKRHGAAAIGSGYFGECGNITINDGFFHRIFSMCAAPAIGSGCGASCEDITINNGIFSQIIGGYNSIAIGAGGNHSEQYTGWPSKVGKCGKITINGGYIEPIGGGVYQIPERVTASASFPDNVKFGSGVVTKKVTHVKYQNEPDRTVTYVGSKKEATCTESGHAEVYGIVAHHTELNTQDNIVDGVIYYSSIERTAYDSAIRVYNVYGDIIGDEGALTVWLETPVSEGGGMIPALGHIDENGDNTCDKCGAENLHDFTGEYKDNGDGTHSRKCTECDKYGATKNHTFVNHECVCGATNGHSFTGEYKNNGDGTHSRKCTECDKYGATENHTFVKHECVCGATNDHDFTDTEYQIVDNSLHKKRCTVCDEWFEEDHNFVNGVCVCGLAKDVPYIDRGWDADTRNVTENKNAKAGYAVILTKDMTELGSGWYYLNSSFETDERIVVNGTSDAPTCIILGDGCTLTANAGIRVNLGKGLLIYAQSKESGSLIANPGTDTGNAAIGGDRGNSGGTIVVFGGSVTATGGNGAGIGGAEGEGFNSYGCSATTFSIYGGTVTATGNKGAGIGGGFGECFGGAGGTVNIYGGTVNAAGNNGAAGIGGAYGSQYGGVGGTVNIYSGTVTATGAEGAGIGGGYGGYNNGGAGGTVNIFGGTVTATGAEGAGIGGGCGVEYGGNGGTVTITGGVVTATSAAGAGIGGGHHRNIFRENGHGELIVSGAMNIYAGNAAPGSKTTLENYQTDRNKYVRIVEHPHVFAGDYADNGNGTHSRKCTECDKYGATEEHTDANSDNICDKCGAIIDKTIPTYTGMSLTLSSDIAVNFYMNLTDEAKQNGKMTFDIGGRIVENVAVKYNGTEKKYYFSTPLTVLEMAETITATFSFNGVEYVQEYSVEQYIEAILNGKDKDGNPFSDEMNLLARKIANYGHYAQEYLASLHSNVTIGDGGYAAMEKFVDVDINVENAKTALADYRVTVTGASEHLSLYGTTVYFDSATALNYYVTVNDGSVPAASCTGKTVTVTEYKGNQPAANEKVYIISVKDILATELADEITVAVNGELTITGSVLAYCNSVMAAHSVEDPADKDTFAVNAMAAFCEYYQAAAAYTASLSED